MYRMTIADVSSLASSLSLKHTMNWMITLNTVVTMITARLVPQPSIIPKFFHRKMSHVIFAPVMSRNITNMIAAEQLPPP